MALSSPIQSALLRHQQSIHTALQQAVSAANTREQAGPATLTPYYGQMRYHLGWVDTTLAPIANNPGKLLRPTLLLLSYEAAGAWGRATSRDYLQRALPAAAAVELTHNFSLIHDDIEDGDTERRHRPTLWSVWGIPHGINTGDGMFALARLTLWGTLDAGVEGAIAAQLGAVLDRACLTLSEGQYLDISFERRLDISVAMYLDMIGRKTASLMSCAAEMGARLGTRDQETIDRLRAFGWAMGIAFQVRDDLLGIWASSSESGKTAAGDVYRRKKSLPFLHALEYATEQDQQRLKRIYKQEEPISQEQVEDVLAVFERTETRTYCRDFLNRQCEIAYEALASVPSNIDAIPRRALEDLQAMVTFVETS